MRGGAFILCLAVSAVCLHGVPSEAGRGDAGAARGGLQENHCSDCHTCATPTADDPCLAPCPRHSPEEGPEVVLIDQLSAQFVPVVFAHKLHAQMTEMTGGCALCHHYNPSRRILRCQECHATSDPNELSKPGLRGAYHRQCLGCHREWSHDTDCAVCHAKKTADSPAVIVPDPTDIMGILHPNAEEPVVKIYETDYEAGRLVTFRHRDHVQQYGFRCVACHREENCSSCHTPETSVKPVKTLKQHHAPCALCHETRETEPTSCAHCHADRETPPFSHASTGLLLSEDHDIAGCRDCHVGGRFREKPTCSECHEADVSYPDQLPGTRVEVP